MRPLPFELTNPDTGAALRREANVWRGLPRPAEIVNMDGRQIIHFHPHCDPSRGFYHDSANELGEAHLKPSGIAHRSCYKVAAMRPFIGTVAPDAVIFDLGCNDCQILSFFPKSACRIGVDISCESLFSRSPNALDSGVMHLWIADATRLPVPDGVADVVLCCDIIEHLFEPEAMLREAYRILKPDGRLFVSVPNLV